MRVLGRLGLRSTNLYAQQAPRMPLTRTITRTVTSKTEDLFHNPKPTTPVCDLEAVVRRLDAAGLIPANLDSRPALDAQLAAGKSDAPANQHPVEAQPLVIYYSPADLNTWAQELEQEAAGVEGGKPHSVTARYKRYQKQIIAAAMRSEAVQIEKPGSAITEKILRETTPAELEGLASLLDKDKRLLKHRALRNPEKLDPSLVDAEKQERLDRHILVVRNQAQLLREQIWHTSPSQDLKS
jgi:hypothetical protein